MRSRTWTFDHYRFGLSDSRMPSFEIRFPLRYSPRRLGTRSSRSGDSNRLRVIPWLAGISQMRAEEALCAGHDGSFDPRYDWRIVTS
jgi:hypothetical protein